MRDDITGLLHAVADGDRGAYDELFPLVYDVLKRIARGRMRSERRDHTLSPTALVHEVYLKLADPEGVEWRDRAQFYAIAARAMRQILVNHALKKKTQKRGGERIQVTLTDAHVAGQPPVHEVLALEEALTRLERDNERRAQVVVCRFYAGMEVKETAAALGISPATVKRDWTAARAWLNQELR